MLLLNVHWSWLLCFSVAVYTSRCRRGLLQPRCYAWSANQSDRTPSDRKLRPAASTAAKRLRPLSLAPSPSRYHTHSLRLRPRRVHASSHGVCVSRICVSPNALRSRPPLFSDAIHVRRNFDRIGSSHYPTGSRNGRRVSFEGERPT